MQHDMNNPSKAECKEEVNMKMYSSNLKTQVHLEFYSLPLFIGNNFHSEAISQNL